VAPKQTVRLIAGCGYERIDLVDAKLNSIPLRGGLGAAEANVSPGVYVARFSTSEVVSERAFVVEDKTDDPLVVHGPRKGTVRVDSAAPIAASLAAPEDLAVARALSASAPVNLSQNQRSGSLFLLMRKREIRDVSEPSQPISSIDVRESVCDFASPPWASIALHDSGGLKVVELGDIACQTSLPGCACVHVRLPAGLYLLRFTLAQRSIDQLVFVADGHQTQIFLRKRHLIHRTDQPAADPAQPESWITAKMSVHMAPEGRGFIPDADTAPMHEELLNLLTAGRPVATLPDFAAKLISENSPFLKLLFWLTQSTVHDGQSTFITPAEARKLADRLDGLPDAEMLWHAASMSQSAKSDPHAPDVETATSHVLSVPPMLLRAWTIALSAENRRRLWIPGNSISARRAQDSVAVGPWFRTSTNEFDATRGDDGAEQGAALSEGERLGLEGEPFDSFLTDLGKRLRIDPKARIQLASSQFSFSERRFLTLLIPESDSTIFQIAEATPTPEASRKSGLNEDGLVEALCIPRSSLCQLAFSTFKKLFQQPILPDAAMLRRFIDDEFSNQGVLRDALEELHRRKTKITHAVERYTLSELELLFLHYEHPRVAELADLLNGLDFMVPNQNPKARMPKRKLRSTDLSAAISSIREFLSTPVDLTSETGLAISDSREQVQIALAGVNSYRRGGLLTVKRSRGGEPKGHRGRQSASPRDGHAHSYSEDFQVKGGARRHSSGDGSEAVWKDDRSMRDDYRMAVEASASTLHAELSELLERQ
jgi:hypothetical protein